MAPLLHLVLPTSHFLMKSEAVRGRRAGPPPTLLQIKSFTNDGKLVQIKTLLSIFLPGPRPADRSDQRFSARWLSAPTRPSSSRSSCSFSCIILHACRSASHSGTRWAQDAAGFSLSLRLHVGKPARKLFAAPAPPDDAAAPLQ